MIYIFSQARSEKSTEKVIDWLLSLGAEFKRINGNEYLDELSHVISNGQKHDSSPKPGKGDIVWLRRWFDKGHLLDRLRQSTLSNKNLIELYTHLSSDVKTVSDYYWQTFKEAKWLTYPYELRYNKLEVLEEAKECGLIIPTTIITTSRSEVMSFKEKFGRIITKVMSHGSPQYEHEKYFIGLCTVEITNEFITGLPQKIFPALFQELIEKEYEIRCFFLGETLYPMAIFSQNNERTKIDFRNYDHSKPNRTVPYRLPVIVEEMLLKLIEKLKLTTGSIDIVKDLEGRYVFLEVNPIGQFGMTSVPCNYFLEEKIANYLRELEINNVRKIG